MSTTCNCEHKQLARYAEQCRRLACLNYNVAAHLMYDYALTMEGALEIEMGIRGYTLTKNPAAPPYAEEEV